MRREDKAKEKEMGGNIEILEKRSKLSKGPPKELKSHIYI